MDYKYQRVKLNPHHPGHPDNGGTTSKKFFAGSHRTARVFDDVTHSGILRASVRGSFGHDFCSPLPTFSAPACVLCSSHPDCFCPKVVGKRDHPYQSRSVEHGRFFRDMF
ncbi:hypothetical protein CEXT_309311 [Caerostris extrusa]|uniref:Uncharacterized protein n=1 Tax=Caerostris extrusa TaxID=172846 RepID=A0AAV4R531_CAEEX|nr:hypothetical protein CEXT_309311 [Caerostris extrusa]